MCWVFLVDNGSWKRKYFININLTKEIEHLIILIYPLRGVLSEEGRVVVEILVCKMANMLWAHRKYITGPKWQLITRSILQEKKNNYFNKFILVEIYITHVTSKKSKSNSNNNIYCHKTFSMFNYFWYSITTFYLFLLINIFRSVEVMEDYQ